MQSVEKLQKKCTIKFAEHEMRIICAGDVNEGGIQVWSYASPFENTICVVLPLFRQIKVSSLFTEYRIQSNNNNEITISLSAEALLAALRSAAGPSTAQNSSNTVASESEVTMK